MEENRFDQKALFADSERFEEEWQSDSLTWGRTQERLLYRREPFACRGSTVIEREVHTRTLNAQ